MLAQTSPAGTAAFGQTVTITATISSTHSGTPTGAVAFSVDGGQARNVNLTGTTAQILLTGLTGGNHSISASYSGDLSFAPSNAAIAITVGQAATTTVVITKGGNQNPPSATPGTPLQLIAIIMPGASTVPTGQVTFTLNGKPLAGPASVTPVSTTVGSVTTTIYQASISLSTLPSGTDSIVAFYGGDVNYASSSATQAVIITPMTFTISPTSSNVTVSAGQTVPVAFQIASLAGYTGYVGLTCTGLPANVICGFSPNAFLLQADNQITAPYVPPPGSTAPSVAATFGPMNVALSVITGAPPVVSPPPVGALSVPFFGGRVPISLALLIFSPVALFVRRRTVRRLRGSLSLLSAMLVLFGSITLFSGCGSNLVGVTPKGNYTVTVHAVSTASANSYTGTFAPGCSNAPAGSTIVTCEQDAQFSLTVQ